MQPTAETVSTAEIASWVQAVASALTVVATVYGFTLLSGQIKRADHALQRADLARRVDAHGDLYEHQYQIHQFFLQHLELRQYFYDDVPAPEDDPTRCKTLVLAEMIADFCEHIHVQLPALPSDTREGWRAYMAQLYAGSPTLRDHFKKHEGWYSKDLLMLLRRANPEPPKLRRG